MEQITIGQVAVFLAFLVALWGSIETIAKKVSKAFDSSLDKKLKPLEDKRKRTDELDKVFQFYIRLRDSRDDGRCKCISCGKIVPFDKIQAGHYRSRKNFSTR